METNYKSRYGSIGEEWDLWNYGVTKKEESSGLQVGIYSYKVDGSLERYKARLVARGYTQTYGVDYQETFVSVTKMNVVKNLLSLVAHFDWNLQQFYLTNTFLHDEIDKEIYTEVPPNFGEV